MTSAIEALHRARFSQQVLFGREVKNILLLHIGGFEAIMIEDLLTAFEKEGVKFISYEEAIKDPIYSIDPHLKKSSGGNFL